jgi:hypothetical protein
LEIAKVQLNTGDEAQKRATRRTLIRTLETILRLAHPITPFITEALWQTVAVVAGRIAANDQSASISIAAYPVSQPERIDEQAEAYVARVKSLVDACRNLRGEMGVSPATRMPLFALAGNAEEHSFMQGVAPVLQALAKLSEVKIFDSEAEWSAVAQAAPVAVIGELRVCLFIEVVVAAEKIRLGKEVVKEEYGNLFDMYEKITGENPYETPMRIYPAVHYTMGGLWVDYELQTTVKGLYALGEANFSDHGANRLGASALMQGLADGYFVIPYTIGNYLADEIHTANISTDHPAFVEAEKAVTDRLQKLMQINGKQTVESFHKRLGKIMWDKCGMARSEQGLKQAIQEIQDLKKEFWSDVRIPGEMNEMNLELDKAGRVADFIELGELMCVDALNRNESCGGHFREESQTEDGEAKRDDVNFSYVAAWENKAESGWELHKEMLQFEIVKPTQRSYK